MHCVFNKKNFVFLVLCFFFGNICGQERNVCPTMLDYYSVKNNSNCWYNFAADSKAPDIIRKSGYPLIEYKIETKDGYILTVFRIPSSHPTKGPVFLMHGVQSTSGIFVSLGKDSLAFLLADAGYDVWLGNYRGNEYSEGHKYLNVSMRDFWNYGVDEIALIDIPTMLNTVRYHTYSKGKIIYIGHSLGTTTAMMYASEYPEHAKENIKLFLWVSPAYKLTHMKSPYRALFPLIRTAQSVTHNFNLVQLISRGYARRFSRPACLSSPILMLGCLNIINLFLGPFTEIAPETIPVYLTQLPGGTSLKTLIYLQEAVEGRFKKFDYGQARNMVKYGTSTPPEYDLSKIQVPVFLFYAKNDWCTTRRDAIDLYKTLPKEIRLGVYEVKKDNFNHYDFFFGPSARPVVYTRIFKVINAFEKRELSS